MRSIILFISLCGVVLADIISDCKIVNKILDEDDGADCCSIGFPKIKCSTTGITYLDLSNNNLEGTIPVKISQIPELTVLNLSNNNFTGTIPAQFGEMLNVTDLNLSNNTLTGEIPIELSNLKSLKTLDLSNNELTKINEKISQLSLLTDLNISNNKISGSIPGKLCTMTNLRYVDLSHNNFSGVLPTTLGNLVNLIEFNIEGNLLSGKIPDTISQIKDLLILNLGSNNFTGSIPSDSIAALTKLIGINLEKNKYLTGKIPSFKPLDEGEDILCLFSNTELCFTKESDYDTHCKLPLYKCDKCVENAKATNGMCDCNSGYDGIGYVSCSKITSGNDDKPEVDGAMASISRKFFLSLLFIIVSIVIII